MTFTARQQRFLILILPLGLIVGGICGLIEGWNKVGTRYRVKAKG